MEELVADQKVVGLCYGWFWGLSIPKCRGIKIAEGHWRAGSIRKADNGAVVMIGGYAKRYRIRQYLCWAAYLFVKYFNKSFGVHAGEILFDTTINGK